MISALLRMMLFPSKGHSERPWQPRRSLLYSAAYKALIALWQIEAKDREFWERWKTTSQNAPLY